MSVKLLAEHHLEFLSLKGGCTGLSESTLVKIPRCWESHVAAQMVLKCFSLQIPEPDSSIQSISIDPMGTMMAAVTNKVRCYIQLLRTNASITFAKGVVRFIFLGFSE